MGKVYLRTTAGGSFFDVNLATGAMTEGPSTSCGPISSATIDAQGRGVGVNLINDTVDRFDPASGDCMTLFQPPERIDALTATQGGDIVAQSAETSFGNRTIYRLSATGEVLSSVTLAGGISFTGLATASNGEIYGPTSAAGWTWLDPVTGATMGISALPPGAFISRVCINSADVAYLHGGGTLFSINATTGIALDDIVLEIDPGLPTIVCR